MPLGSGPDDEVSSGHGLPRTGLLAAAKARVDELLGGLSEATRRVVIAGAILVIASVAVGTGLSLLHRVRGPAPTTVVAALPPSPAASGSAGPASPASPTPATPGAPSSAAQQAADYEWAEFLVGVLVASVTGPQDVGELTPFAGIWRSAPDADGTVTTMRLTPKEDLSMTVSHEERGLGSSGHWSTRFLVTQADARELVLVNAVTGTTTLHLSRGGSRVAEVNLSTGYAAYYGRIDRTTGRISREATGRPEKIPPEAAALVGDWTRTDADGALRVVVAPQRQRALGGPPLLISSVAVSDGTPTIFPPVGFRVKTRGDALALTSDEGTTVTARLEVDGGRHYLVLTDDQGAAHRYVGDRP